MGSKPGPAEAERQAAAPAARGGILPRQAIAELIADGEIRGAGDLAELVQPASLDLRLGARAHRLRASFLPGRGRTVAERIEQFSMHEVDLTGGALLEVGCVYIVPLMERLALGSQVSGLANPKSSTGRLNLFTRLIVDGAEQFDVVPAGYEGPLYAELAPNAFSVLARSGVRLNQLRFRRGRPGVADSALQRLHREVGLVGEGGAGAGAEAAQIRKGLVFTVDLGGLGPDRLAGFKAKRHADVIDLSRIGHYDPAEFWDPIAASPRGELILDPNEFYILASRETVRIPPDYAAEMVPYDTQIGEFRVHYAGFFDPGFGWDPDKEVGTRAVLEVRSHEVPFLLQDGQPVGRLEYHRLAATPDRLYGAGIGSHYHAQSLTLSKHFRPWGA
ncbi:dCTP deaminase [Tistlia consotensis]|uniref:dCTP deaminase n=1 Tax=Tistlia consotensis USBA 355 TaxID=560819 RepID=A0A1Y6CGI1_9PROT|nr:2'-deoxycytidine 5'-triphosphate deaminase [Tistlia consotensis]SMF60687.1 dCTP deaminase [Tistlia consotensis USBA 355]SNR92980.1 dCTP deaminase [Tistlia consotensis]